MRMGRAQEIDYRLTRRPISAIAANPTWTVVHLSTSSTALKKSSVARVEVVTRCGHWKVPWDPVRQIRVPRYVTAFGIPALLSR